MSYIKDTDLEGSMRDQGFNSKTQKQIDEEQDTAQKNRDNFMQGVSDRAAGEVEKAQDNLEKHNEAMIEKSKKLDKEINEKMDNAIQNRKERMNEVANHNRQVNQP